MTCGPGYKLLSIGVVTNGVTAQSVGLRCLSPCELCLSDGSRAGSSILRLVMVKSNVGAAILPVKADKLEVRLAALQVYIKKVRLA